MDDFLRMLRENGLGDMTAGYDDPQGPYVNMELQFEEALPLEGLRLTVWTPDDGTLHLSTHEILTVPESVMAFSTVSAAVNWLNGNIRWMSTWIDEDRSVRAQCDSLLSESRPGEDAWLVLQTAIVTCGDIRETIMALLSGDTSE